MARVRAGRGRVSEHRSGLQRHDGRSKSLPESFLGPRLHDLIALRRAPRPSQCSVGDPTSERYRIKVALRIKVVNGGTTQPLDYRPFVQDQTVTPITPFLDNFQFADKAPTRTPFALPTIVSASFAGP